MIKISNKKDLVKLEMNPKTQAIKIEGSLQDVQTLLNQLVGLSIVFNVLK